MNETTSLKILLADDDKDDCLLFKEALEEVPLSSQLTVLHDGEELMRFLAEKTGELPHVLFLDLNMPRKNGFECLQEIKTNEKLKALPTIIYSTSYEENMADLLYKNGAHHYICKPSNFSQLKKLIEYSLHLVAKEKASQPPKEKFLLSNLTTILI